jgi:hypothetical protein
MYKLQLSLVPTNQLEQLEQQLELLSLPPPSVNYYFIMQQLLESQASTVPWCEGFYSWPFYAAPAYQGMAQEYQHQYRAPSSGTSRMGEHRPFYAAPVYQGMAQEYQHPSQYYRAPSSGPRRTGKHRKGFRKAEAPNRNQLTHESSETVAEDRSTGIHPGHARIGANNNTRVGKVWRTPSKNPIDS